MSSKNSTSPTGALKIKLPWRTCPTGRFINSHNQRFWSLFSPMRL